MLEGRHSFKPGPIQQNTCFSQQVIDAVHPFLQFPSAALQDKALPVRHLPKFLCCDLMQGIFLLFEICAEIVQCHAFALAAVVIHFRLDELLFFVSQSVCEGFAGIIAVPQNDFQFFTNMSGCHVVIGIDVQITVTVPSEPVTNRPLSVPMGLPSLSFTMNSAFARGFFVSASRFRMVRLQRGLS